MCDMESPSQTENDDDKSLINIIFTCLTQTQFQKANSLSQLGISNGKVGINKRQRHRSDFCASSTKESHQDREIHFMSHIKLASSVSKAHRKGARELSSEASGTFDGPSSSHLRALKGVRYAISRLLKVNATDMLLQVWLYGFFSPLKVASNDV